MIMGKRAKQLGDGTWETPGAEGIQEAVGTQLARIYIERRLRRRDVEIAERCGEIEFNLYGEEGDERV